MSTATITPALRTPAGPTRPQVRRPVRQPVSRRGPVARPVSPVPAPSLRSASRSTARSCRVDVAVPAGSWRLTDRGILVVLVLAVMIAVAAATVIGLTAWQVTGSDFSPVAGAAAVSSR
jgi:hypothetical protein